MSDFNLIVSSLVLAILLPVSVAVLYSLMAAHVQLSPESAMHSAALERFDSEAERAEYHAAIETQRQLRRAAVMQRYRQFFEQQLQQRMDPRRAELFRHALAATTDTSPVTDTDAGAAPEEAPGAEATPPDAVLDTDPARTAPRRRPALWRAHLSTLRQ